MIFSKSTCIASFRFEVTIWSELFVPTRVNNIQLLKLAVYRGTIRRLISSVHDLSKRCPGVV